MRRGPAIGGHLPRVPKGVLEQMTLAEQYAYHVRRTEVFRKRASFGRRLTWGLLAVALMFYAIALGLMLA